MHNCALCIESNCTMTKNLFFKNIYYIKIVCFETPFIKNNISVMQGLLHYFELEDETNSHHYITFLYHPSSPKSNPVPSL